MTRPILLHPSALLEIADAAAAYEASRAGYGRLFGFEVERTIALLGVAPRLHQRVDGQVRAAPLHRFPYTLFYLTTDRAVHVLGCVPGRADPAATLLALASRRA